MYSITADQIEVIFWGYFILLFLVVGFGVKIYFQGQQLKQLKEDDRAWWVSYRKLITKNDDLRKAAKIKDQAAK